MKSPTVEGNLSLCNYLVNNFNTNMALLTIKQPYYSWLYQLEICRVPPTPGSTTLTSEESNLWQVGKLFGFLLMTISQQLKISTQSIESLLKLKQTNTVPVRLFNWNILIKIFSNIGIQITPQTKKQIIDGNSAQLLPLIQSIYGLVVKEFVPTNGTIDASLVHLQSQTSQQEQPDYNSITQYLIVTLSKHMQLSKENTINLLHDNNRLLNHLLISGTNEAQQIKSYLSEVQNSVQDIVYLLTDSESINIYCNMFKEGVISNSIPIFQRCLGIYRKSFQSCRLIKDWFKNYSTRYFVKIALDSPERAKKIVSLLSEVYGIDLYEVLKPNQVVKLNLSESQLFVLQLFIENLDEEDLSRYLSSPKFSDWINILISNTRSLKNSYMTITIFKTLWNRASSFFTSHSKELPILYSEFLKQVIMKKQSTNSYVAISTLFDIMDQLGKNRNVYAPHLYKTICSTLELLEPGDKMDYMIKNLINSWKVLPTLPVYLISSTLLRALLLCPTIELIDFVAQILNEGRFEDSDEVEIVNIMFKGYLSTIHYSSSILSRMDSLIDYFEPQRLQSTILDTFKLCLSMFFNINKNHPQLTESFQSHKPNPSSLQDIMNRNQIIRLFTLLKLLVSKFKQWEEVLSKLICQTMISLKKWTGKENQLLMRLFRILHNETSIYQMLEEDIYEEKESVPSSKRQTPDVHESDQKQEQLESEIEEMDGEIEEDGVSEGSQELERYVPDESQYSSSKNQNRASIMYTESVLPIDEDIEYQQSYHYQSNKKVSDISIFPTTPNILPSQYRITKKHSESRSIRPSPTALQSIEDAKNRRLIRIMSEIDREKSMRMAEEEKIKRARRMIEKRSLQFGISKDKDVSVDCLFDWNSLKEHTVQELGLTDIQLMDWDCEEGQHVEALQAILRKYKKLWRYLFLKFSTFGGQKGLKSESDQKMTIAQVWKFLHYYNLPLLKREEMNTLVRLINQSKGNRIQLQTLSYPNFQQFLVQYSNYVHKLNNVVCPSTAHSLLKLIEEMKAVAFIKKDNVSIFQNPQTMYFKEEEVIQEFNKKLMENPEYILPEGYKKVKDTNISFFNEITEPNRALLPKSYVVCMQILSSIIEEHFQTSFLEPLVEKEQIVRAKPVLFQNLGEKLKEHKGYMQPKQVSPSKSEAPRIKHVDKNEFKPLVKFSLGIKLGISSVSMKNKFIAEEVAYLMDDMLNAVQNQCSQVTNLHKVSIVNQRMKDLEWKKEEEKRVEEEKDSRRNRRIREIRKNLSKQRETIKELKQEKQRLRTIQAEEEKQRHLVEEKRYQSIREKVKRKKIIDEENNKMQRDTEEKLKKLREKDRFKSIKEFISKEKESLKTFQLSVKKKKEEEELRRKDQEQKHSSQRQAKLYLNILKSDQHLLGKVVTVKNLYTECWISDGIKQATAKYEPQLRLLFDLLLKHQNSKISTQYSQKISLNTFNHFCLKFKIVPNIVNHSNIISIFKSLLKENGETEGIAFGLFQEALFRICTRAKEHLNSDMNATVKHREMNQLSRKRKATGSVDQYLFDTSQVTKDTLLNLYQYLQLERDKLGMETRYRKAVESST